MRILVISDSHGKTKNIHRVIKKEKSVDMIIHLGDEYNDFLEIQDCYDIPAHGIVGNIDYFDEGPSEKLIEICGMKLFLSHGHRYRVKHNLEFIKDMANDIGANILLFGHSHIPLIEDGEIYILNPGSISDPRTQEYPSYAILEIIDDKVNGDIFLIK